MADTAILPDTIADALAEFQKRAREFSACPLDPAALAVCYAEYVVARNRYFKLVGAM